jgi:hypothetical protein
VSSDRVLARHLKKNHNVKNVGNWCDNAQGNNTNNHMNPHNAGYHSSAPSDGAELLWTRVTPLRWLLALSIVNFGSRQDSWIEKRPTRCVKIRGIIYCWMVCVFWKWLAFVFTACW